MAETTHCALQIRFMTSWNHPVGSLSPSHLSSQTSSSTCPSVSESCQTRRFYPILWNKKTQKTQVGRCTTTDCIKINMKLISHQQADDFRTFLLYFWFLYQLSMVQECWITICFLSLLMNRNTSLKKSFQVIVIEYSAVSMICTVFNKLYCFLLQ